MPLAAVKNAQLNTFFLGGCGLDMRNMLRLDAFPSHKQRGATVAVLPLTKLSLRQLCGFLGSQIYPDREGSGSTAVGCLLQRFGGSKSGKAACHGIHGAHVQGVGWRSV